MRGGPSRGALVAAAALAWSVAAGCSAGIEDGAGGGQGGVMGEATFGGAGAMDEATPGGVGGAMDEATPGGVGGGTDEATAGGAGGAMGEAATGGAAGSQDSGGAGGSASAAENELRVPTLVAVGWNGWRIRSRDLGRTWQDELKTTPIAVYDKGTLLRAVTWGAGGGGMFVAVGAHIWSSPDGAKWIQRDGNDRLRGGFMVDAAYGNGIFLTAGGYGNVHVSSNGIDWTYAGAVRGSGGSGPNVSSVEFGNGKFHVAFDGKVYASADAKTWTEVSGVPAGKSCFQDGKLVPVDQCRPYKVHGVFIRWQKPFLQWSLDGIKWTTGYQNTLEGPVLFGNTAEWLAAGYSTE